MTITLHKLSAGSGYEYLTPAGRSARLHGEGRHTAGGRLRRKGEAPGRWVGSGLVGVAGVAAGDVVTAEQMKHRRRLVRASGQDRGRGSEPLIPAPAA
jgi:hypothetical protein